MFFDMFFLVKHLIATGAMRAKGASIGTLSLFHALKIPDR